MGETSRREFLKGAALTSAAMTTSTLVEGSLGSALAQPPASNPATVTTAQKVTLSWLGEKAPRLNTGVSFGVPWSRGAVARDSVFHLNAAGKDLPTETWPLAYWPDGSIKWSGFAAVLPAGLAGPVTLSTGSTGVSGGVNVKHGDKFVTVDTGALQCSISLAGGTNFIDSMTIESRTIAGPAQLV